MKIKLFCSAGMSTSMLAKKMQDEATSRGLDCTVAAFSEATIDAETNDCDVALLGPQVRFLLSKAQGVCGPKNVPVDVIPMQDYGMMNGKNVLDKALAMAANK
ncbi:MAG: PTS sugar transporter subunit IIB [Turicibacter sp.]|nr:PTS sugar transporter subunit IIB [Turicibacter sp.]